MAITYLDNNATTPIAPEVLEAMRPYLYELYGNPSSMHTFGGQLHRHIEDARASVAALIGAEPEEIVFTSCGTESDNLALASAVQCQPGRRHLITTRVEHPAILNFSRHLARKGHRLTLLPVDANGELDMDAFREALDDDTAIVSAMMANNETGVLFDIAAIAEEARSRGALVHTDAVQVAGKVRIDVNELGVDMLSLSGHKVHAPKGVGALYVRKGTRFSPLIIGGHQERGRRGGTENVASIVGFGRACAIAHEWLDKEGPYLAALRDRLEHGLLKACPDARINGRPDMRLPNTLNIGFSYVEGEAILLRLDEHGICASSGSACTSGSLEPSHVLRAMGVPHTEIHGSIRLSLSRYNTGAEVDKVLDIMPAIIAELRKLSPFGR